MTRLAPLVPAILLAAIAAAGATPASAQSPSDPKVVAAGLGDYHITVTSAGPGAPDPVECGSAGPFAFEADLATGQGRLLGDAPPCSTFLTAFGESFGFDAHARRWDDCAFSSGTTVSCSGAAPASGCGAVASESQLVLGQGPIAFSRTLTTDCVVFTVTLTETLVPLLDGFTRLDVYA